MTAKTTDLCDERPEALALPAVFRDYGGKRSFEGPAQTVKCHEDNSRLKEQSQTPGQGRVLVVDGGGSLRCALLGDLIAGDLVKNGWAGVVIFGCVRDTAALAQLPLGVKALAAHPRRSNKHGEGQVGLALELGGARVRPGDRVVADEDGVVILPA